MPDINNYSSLRLPLNYEYQGHAWAVIKSFHIRRDIMDGVFQIMEKFFSNRHSAPDLGINLPIALTQYLQNDLLVSC